VECETTLVELLEIKDYARDRDLGKEEVARRKLYRRRKKPLPSESDFQKHVPLLPSLESPVICLWCCDHFPDLKFKTATEAAVLSQSEGYDEPGRMFVEVYEYVTRGSKAPLLVWVYEVEIDPLNAYPISPLLDYDGDPIDEDDDV
jgi:hypothetical protein